MQFLALDNNLIETSLGSKTGRLSSNVHISAAPQMCFVVDVEKSQLEAGWVLLSQEKDKKSQTIMPNDIELESCTGIC